MADEAARLADGAASPRGRLSIDVNAAMIEYALRPAAEYSSAPTFDDCRAVTGDVPVLNEHVRRRGIALCGSPRVADPAQIRELKPSGRSTASSTTSSSASRSCGGAI